MVIHFPAYRNFIEARVGAIDAMTSLIMGSRLSIKELEAVEDSSIRLPELHEEIAGITRLNRTVAEAIQLLREGESHLVYMAIPYALSVYGTLLIDTAKMLREDGRESTRFGPQLNLDKLSLDIAHEYIEDCCNGTFNRSYLSLFQFSRRVRNRIVHSKGSSGSHLGYSNLPPEARANLERASNARIS